jgi:putative transposase
MKLTLTAKVKLFPTQEQQDLLLKTVHAIKQALNHTSRFSHKHEVFATFALHNNLYRTLHTTYGLRSQMAQSVFKTVKYGTAKLVVRPMFASRCSKSKPPPHVVV